MARPAIGNPFENQIGSVGPTAAPVDTYKRSVVQRSPFEALAKSLARLEEKATPAIQAAEARAAEAEYAAGQQLWADTRVQFGKAVKDGLIQEGESPYLRKGYRMANLNVLSANYATDLKAQMEKKKLYHNGDPAKIEAFITQFQADYRDKNGLGDFSDTETAEVFLPNALKANMALKASWREKHTAYMTAQIYTSFGNEINAYTYSITDQTLPLEKRTQLAAGLADFITAKSTQADIDGLDRTKVGKIIGDSLRLSALENLSLAPLDLMDDIILGTGKLSSTPANRKANLQTRAEIAKLIEDRDDAADTERQEKIDVEVANITEDGKIALQDLLSPFESTRGYAVTKIARAIDLLRIQAEDDDTGNAAQQIVDLQKLQKTFQNWETAASTEDAVEYVELLTDLQDEDDNSKRITMITKAADDGIITPAQAKSLFDSGYANKTGGSYARVSAGGSPVQKQFNLNMGLMKGDTGYITDPDAKMLAAQLQLKINNALTDEMTVWLKDFEETKGKPATDRELELAAREAMAKLIQTEVYDAAALAEKIKDQTRAENTAKLKKKTDAEGISGLINYLQSLLLGEDDTVPDEDFFE
jgi:hypothetical protein